MSPPPAPKQYKEGGDTSGFSWGGYLGIVLGLLSAVLGVCVCWKFGLCLKLCAGAWMCCCAGKHASGCCGTYLRKKSSPSAAETKKKNNSDVGHIHVDAGSQTRSAPGPMARK